MRALGLGLGGSCLVAAGGQPHARLGQRGLARRLAVEIALARARLGLGVARRIEGGLRGLQGAALVFDLCAGARQFAVDLGKAAALRQPPGGAGRCVRGRDKAVPAPQVAVARNQPLAGLERRSKPDTRLALDHADLRQPAGKLRRRLDVARERRRRPSGSAGSPASAVTLLQCIGEDASTGASRSSPSAAPSAFS